MLLLMMLLLIMLLTVMVMVMAMVAIWPWDVHTMEIPTTPSFQVSSSGDVVRCAWDGGHDWLFNNATGTSTTLRMRTKDEHSVVACMIGQLRCVITIGDYHVRLPCAAAVCG